MKAIVVYESMWGNTAAVARAVAEGIGGETRAVPTDQASPEDVAGADLVVAGAPVMGFRLGTEEMRASVAGKDTDDGPAPDLAHPSLRSWLEKLPHGDGRSAAAFETRIWWSPRGATGDITSGFEKAGYESVGVPAKFVVRHTHGPLRAGEIERARAWGTGLAASVEHRKQEVPA